MNDLARAEPGWPLVLVGLPGAGKSTVGALVAARLAVPFVDLDEAIEDEAGMPVAAIFAARGEAAFRALESALTARHAGRRIVLATGGGWMAQPSNPGLVRPPAQIVHLRVETASALDRIGRSGTERPLLAGTDPAGALADLARRRAAAYGQADAVVDTEGLTAQEVASAVCALR